MSTPLHPCPACRRHVFEDACDCPFCGAKLAPGSCAKVAPPPGYRRMSRAARLAAGAALAGVSACFSGSAAYGAYMPSDASTDNAGEGGASAAGADGKGGAAAGAAGEGGAAAAGGRGIGGAPAGGAAGHPAAGGNGGRPSPTGTGGALYGGPPASGGAAGPVPVYGAAPVPTGKDNG